MPSTNSQTQGHVGTRRQWAGAAATLLLIGIGIGVSVYAADVVARHANDAALHEFEDVSGDVASSMQQAIDQEKDLAADVGALLVDPEMSATSFREWAEAARLLERSPEIDSVGALVLVTSADLPAFAASAVADPSGALTDEGTFEIVPSGTRPFYCLAAAGVSTISALPAPAGADYCVDPTTRDPLLEARDLGHGAYTPYTVAGEARLVVYSPIYRADARQASIAERRAAFAGWVVTVLDPTSLLDQASRNTPAVAAELRFRRGGTDVTFTSGTSTPELHSATTDLYNGWTIRTFGVVRPSGIADGEPLLVLLGGSAMSVLLGLLLFVLGTGRERARRQLVHRTSQLHHQALHDALTGLPNRALVMDRIEQMLARGRRNRTQGAVLFLDLDDFKNVNDTLGHGAGDRLLIGIAARLQSTLRGVDTIGRMGGDEFVVLVDGTSTDAAPELVAQRLLDMMRQPFELDEISMPLSVNVSVGLASGDRESADDLLRDADVALYQAKGAGKNRYEIFDPMMHSTVGRRTDLEFDLRSALADTQFRLDYQPIYQLDDLSVVGVEALLRWDHPTRGLISPAEFVPILEQTGQIQEVGRWVLQQACAQMATWHSRGDTLDISVNVSGRQLDHDSIIDDVHEALRDSGLAPQSLIIEVTETALMNNVEATARRLHAIKALGVRVAVDDFGTGYSSLAYLRQFPVDCLKIDRMFTSAVTASPESKALVGTLVQLGKDLGLTTLAEGVETTDEMDILRGAEVDQAQGFLMARPLDPVSLEAQLLAPTRPASATRS